LNPELPPLKGHAFRVDVGDPNPFLRHLGDDVAGDAAVAAGEVQEIPAPGRRAELPGDDLLQGRPDPAARVEIHADRLLQAIALGVLEEQQHLVRRADVEVEPAFDQVSAKRLDDDAGRRVGIRQGV
jgi:hypothetical protein